MGSSMRGSLPLSLHVSLTISALPRSLDHSLSTTCARRLQATPQHHHCSAEAQQTPISTAQTDKHRKMRAPSVPDHMHNFAVEGTNHPINGNGDKRSRGGARPARTRPMHARWIWTNGRTTCGATSHWYSRARHRAHRPDAECVG